MIAKSFTLAGPGLNFRNDAPVGYGNFLKAVISLTQELGVRSCNIAFTSR